MSRRSGVLEFAVLGLLRESPMHGYELRKRLNTSLGVFRAFSYGTLYPCLKTLVAQGWLTEETGGRPRSALGRCTGRAPGEDRLPADRRGQGALRGTARPDRPGRLGGRALRRPLRLLRADRAGCADAGPGRPPQPPGGAPGADARLPGPHPRAARRLHPRAATARHGVRGARGPLAERAHRDRAGRTRISDAPEPQSTDSRTIGDTGGLPRHRGDSRPDPSDDTAR